jgi:hypothetical protein
VQDYSQGNIFGEGNHMELIVEVLRDLMEVKQQIFV